MGLRFNEDLIAVIEDSGAFNNVTEKGETNVVGRSAEEREVRGAGEVSDGCAIVEVFVDGVASVDECDCFSHIIINY